MHYFKRNIGDYHKKAGRLTMLQHGAYTLLMDACYDRERFPTMEEAIDWCWASTEEEIAAVKFVLAKFFELVDGRYEQTRIQEEIDAFNSRSEKNRQIALEREEKRRSSTRSVRKTARNVLDASPDENESPPTQEPLTTNQEPETSKTNTRSDTSDVDLVFDHWRQVMDHPKAANDEKRRKLIRARLADGYTAADLCNAITGYSLSPWHMGENDRKTKYDGLDLILRDCAKVDKGLEFHATPPVPAPKSAASAPRDDRSRAHYDRTADNETMKRQMAKYNIQPYDGEQF